MKHILIRAEALVILVLYVPFACLADSSPLPAASGVQAVGTSNIGKSFDMDQYNSKAEPLEKSYLVPGVEIVGFEFLLNQFNRHFASDHRDYDTGFGTFRDNLRRKWVFDKDPFNINQIGHPYQGSIYYGFARSAGLNFWESAGYTVLGSALWETGGETVPPSINDQITTSIGGSFLGEALYRISETFNGSSSNNRGAFREIGAAIVSPPSGFNRLVFGRRVNPDLPSLDPAIFARVQLGMIHNQHVSRSSDWVSADENVASASFDMDYGLPGKPGYDYNRPFDYFNFEGRISSSSNDPLENLSVYGLLLGEKYGGSQSFRGIFGLYGSYEYFAPEIFRVATSALSVGTTGQWWLSDAVALQGSTLGGVGFGAAGTIAETNGSRDYHYGAVPQGVISLRLIIANRVMLDCSGREYYITGSGSDGKGSRAEDIAREQVSLTVRVQGHHALGLEFTGSQRNAPFSKGTDRHQHVDAIGIFYTYLMGEHLGAVEWGGH